MTEVTRILNSIDQGDSREAEQLLLLVYDELRKLAAHKLVHERPGHTLQPTALVHEAYIRLVGCDKHEVAEAPAMNWNSRGHFFAAAAEAMKRILVENARRKQRLKRGRGLVRKELDASNIAASDLADDLLALDEALGKLAATDERAAKLVQLRYFAGLSIDDAALTLGISPRTADRLWSYARAWLHSEIYE